MSIIKQTLVLTALITMATACAGKESEKVAAMQKKDKNLTCREVLLEQNEAEFYRSTAEKNKQPGVKAVLMPLGYISTYMSAEDAVSAANARTDYLSRIYEIMDCDNKLQMASRKNKIVSRQMADGMETMEEGAPVAMPAPAQAPVMQPVPMGYVVPQPYQPMSYQPTPQAYYQPMSYYRIPQGNAFDTERAGRAVYVGTETYGPAIY